MRPYITEEECNQCRECIDFCPYDVFSNENGNVRVTNPEDCVECMSCVEGCPNKAVYMDD